LYLRIIYLCICWIINCFNRHWCTVQTWRFQTCDFSGEPLKGFEVLSFSTSATTTQPLSGGEFCKMHYDTIPVKSASANVSFYANNQKMPNFELWHSCRKWAIRMQNRHDFYWRFVSDQLYDVHATFRRKLLLSKKLKEVDADRQKHVYVSDDNRTSEYFFFKKGIINRTIRILSRRAYRVTSIGTYTTLNSHRS